LIAMAKVESGVKGTDEIIPAKEQLKKDNQE
jgi:hypothetical protein